MVCMCMTTSDSQVSRSLVMHGLWRTVSGQVKAHVVLMESRPIIYLWLRRATDHEPHCRHVPVNNIWRRTEPTARSGQWRSHMAGIYTDCSTRKKNKTSSCQAKWYSEWTVERTIQRPPDDSQSSPASPQQSPVYEQPVDRYTSERKRQQDSHRPQTPPSPGVATLDVTLSGRKLVPCVRWPATGITAHIL